MFLLKERYNMLNAVLAIAAAGEGATNHCIRHLSDRNGNLLLLLPFFCLGLDNALHLFFHRGEQLELEWLGFLRRRNGRLSACRLLCILIYL